MLFNGWLPLIRTLVVGVLAYVSLVFLLRISGKRTLSKMNAFDLIITVALGSTLATILLSKDVSLAQGVVGLGLLIGMQFVVTWYSVRTRWVRRLVTGEPTMLVYRGEILPRALIKTRVTEDEVNAAARSSGVASLKELEALILETDGKFSVIKPRPGDKASTLAGVKLPGEEAGGIS